MAEPPQKKQRIVINGDITCHPIYRDIRHKVDLLHPASYPPLRLYDNELIKENNNKVNNNILVGIKRSRFYSFDDTVVFILDIPTRPFVF
jgi:predicted nucleic acid-binding OB-fold protein